MLNRFIVYVILFKYYIPTMLNRYLVYVFVYLSFCVFHIQFSKLFVLLKETKDL